MWSSWGLFFFLGGGGGLPSYLPQRHAAPPFPPLTPLYPGLQCRITEVQARIKELSTEMEDMDNEDDEEDGPWARACRSTTRRFSPSTRSPHPL